MEITEVRIKLVEKTTERLMAFCSITIDGAFVIRDLKLIGGPHGLFVACLLYTSPSPRDRQKSRMPSSA